MSSSSTSPSMHRTQAPADTSCSCCWDDIDSTNYVEYKSAPDSEWLSSGFCVNCIQHLINSQWDAYVNGLAKTTCKAEQRRLLRRGPPINVRDPKALICPDEGEVYLLWFMNDGMEHSAKLTGSLEGEARKKFWDDQMLFYITDEAGEDGEEKKDAAVDGK